MDLFGGHEGSIEFVESRGYGSVKAMGCSGTKSKMLSECLGCKPVLARVDQLEV